MLFFVVIELEDGGLDARLARQHITLLDFPVLERIVLFHLNLAANELLFVNKRLGVLDTANTAVPAMSPLAVANNPDKADCQPVW